MLIRHFDEIKLLILPKKLESQIKQYTAKHMSPLGKPYEEFLNVDQIFQYIYYYIDFAKGVEGASKENDLYMSHEVAKCVYRLFDMNLNYGSAGEPTCTIFKKEREIPRGQGYNGNNVSNNQSYYVKAKTKIRTKYPIDLEVKKKKYEKYFTFGYSEPMREPKVILSPENFKETELLKLVIWTEGQKVNSTYPEIDKNSLLRSLSLLSNERELPNIMEIMYGGECDEDFKDLINRISRTLLGKISAINEQTITLVISSEAPSTRENVYPLSFY